MAGSGRIGCAGLSWHGFAPLGGSSLDPGFVSDLAEAGCAMLQLGLESGSQGLLDRMGKGTRVEDASRILSNLSRAGISAYVYAMLGFPGRRGRMRNGPAASSRTMPGRSAG